MGIYGVCWSARQDAACPTGSDLKEELGPLTVGAAERRPDERYRLRNVREHDAGRDTQHPVARAREALVSTRIRPLAAAVSVVAAVHFHDELPSGSEEVHDAGPDDDLAAEPDPSLPPDSLAHSRRSEVMGRLRMLRAKPWRRTT